MSSEITEDYHVYHMLSPVFYLTLRASLTLNLEEDEMYLVCSHEEIKHQFIMIVKPWVQTTEAILVVGF